MTRRPYSIYRALKSIAFGIIKISASGIGEEKPVKPRPREDEWRKRSRKRPIKAQAAAGALSRPRINMDDLGYRAAMYATKRGQDRGFLPSLTRQGFPLI